jgi:hypothetical protein
MTVEGAEHFIEIAADGHFVVEEILQPDVILAMGQGDEGEQFTETDANRRLLLRCGGNRVAARRIDTKVSSHEIPPVDKKSGRGRTLQRHPQQAALALKTA